MPSEDAVVHIPLAEAAQDTASVPADRAAVADHGAHRVAAPAKSESGPDSSLNDLAEKRLNSMYLTKGSRYEASRRHKKSNRTSTISIVILSTYIFAISVISFTYKNDITTEWESILKSVSLIMSFLVVAFSLFQSGHRHDLRSELFLKCAQSIDEIWSNLCREKQLNQLTPDKIKQYDDEYRKVITNFADNHSDIDFQIFRFKTGENPKHKTDRRSRMWARLRRIYWNWKLHFYVWKNVYIATIFPWIMLFGFLLWRRIIPPAFAISQAL